MTHEIWKPIPGTKGYEASSEGRIRNSKGRVLKDAAHVCGYRLITCLRPDGTRWQNTVHAFVALAFHGPRPDGMEVAHGDHIKTNNRPSNLRYATKVENMNDGHPRRSSYWLPWNKIEVGQSFVSRTHINDTKPRAERAGAVFGRAFEVSRIPGEKFKSLVTRIPMLDAMTCQATAEVGGAA